VLWVVIQSHLDNLHRCIGHLERFIPPSQKNFGEMGMSLTLIEAAVSHITQMQPESYGLSSSIEVDGQLEKAHSVSKRDTNSPPPTSISKQPSFTKQSTTPGKGPLPPQLTQKPTKIVSDVVALVKKERTRHDTITTLL